jgi:hypothetical protein
MAAKIIGVSPEVVTNWRRLPNHRSGSSAVGFNENLLRTLYHSELDNFGIESVPFLIFRSRPERLDH